MALYEVIITDVTCYGNLFCVAGWDIHNARMIRPEPQTSNVNYEASRFWGADFAGQGRFFDVGNQVRFEANPPAVTFPFPHATEDRIYQPTAAAKVVSQLNSQQIAAAVAGGVCNAVSNAFGGHLVRSHSGKCYVPGGTHTNSLDAIEVTPGSINFYEDNPGGKRRLRAEITHGGLNYDFSVPASAARTRFLADGAAAIKADADASNRVHVRLGLCRPFADVPNCYAQVNGLIFCE